MKDVKYLTYGFWGIVACFTLLFSSSLFWNIRNEYNSARQIAKIEGSASYKKDLLYRRWASMHGGVYVPITETTQPNPYLKVINRDIRTTDGKELTLINPAYMTRQVHELGNKEYGVKGHITSLNPLRPANKPDKWEELALQSFEKGVKEVSIIMNINGNEFLRYMWPMITEKSCLKCHASQGYKMGQIRGGISVSVPLDKYYAIAASQVKVFIIGHVLVYISILIILYFGFLRIRREMIEKTEIQNVLLNNEVELRIQNNEYASLNEEYKAQNTELLRVKDQLEENDRLKSAFLHNMSHEIRTPLNAIMGFADLLFINFSNKEKLDKFSTIIKQRSNDLLEIINDVLDIAKIESGQLPVHSEEFELKNVFTEIGTFFYEYRIRFNKQAIDFHISTGCLSPHFLIVTDAVKLKQIFINLISNSFKFTEAGKIEAGCMFGKNKQLIFFVSDTGIGIPKEKYEIIFERFVQADYDTTRKYGGSGLGLSIVKGLLDLLGGKIWVESVENNGSTFYFTIPFDVRSVDLPTTEKSLADSVSIVASPSSILIVEDDSYNAEYLKEILSETGHNIYHTEFGQEAIQIASELNVDLILMDIRLPDMLGFEAIKAIKAKNSSIRIIVQSAYASFADKQKALDAGCDDYIVKPILRDLFLEKVKINLLKKTGQV